MPPRDPRLRPALERALPADSGDTSGYRTIGEPWLVLFGDGEWHQVQVLAVWLDREGRRVVQVEWHGDRETWGETYVYDAERVRAAPDL